MKYMSRKGFKRVLSGFLAAFLIGWICPDATDGSSLAYGEQESDMMKRTAVILDSDPGTDDACAFLVMARALKIQPDFIVASHGNTSQDGACRNVLLLGKMLGMSGKVVKGLLPPENEYVDAEESNTFHGPDGLAGQTDQMMRDYPIDLNEVISFDDFKQSLNQYDAITYIAVGTLTNLAGVLSDPAIAGKINSILLMGGGFKEFNCAHQTEFNFSKDPVGVRQILSSGKDITLFPLDLTNHQRVDEAQINSWEQGNPYPYYIDFLKYNRMSNAEHGIDAAVLHDTMPVLYLGNPNWFTLEDRIIICDDYGHIEESDQGCLVHVALDVEEGLMIRMMEKAFGFAEEEKL